MLQMITTTQRDDNKEWQPAKWHCVDDRPVFPISFAAPAPAAWKSIQGAIILSVVLPPITEYGQQWKDCRRLRRKGDKECSHLWFWYWLKGLKGYIFILLNFLIYNLNKILN